MLRHTGRAETGLVVVIAALGLLFWGLLGPFDLQTFVHAGHQVVHGHSPYVAPTDPVFRAGHAFVYPAFVAWAFAPLAALPGWLGIDIYAAASVAAIVLAARWFGRPGAGPVALVLVSSTTVIAVQMGTVNPLLLFGLAAAWRLRDDHGAWSGVVLGLVAAVKLFLIPLLVWPLLRRRYPAALAAIGTFAALLGSEGLLGHISVVGYFGLLSHLQNSETVRSWSLSSFLQSAGLAATPAGDLVVGLCCAALLGLWSARRRLSDAQCLGLVVITCLALSPIVWSSYLLLATAPLLLLGPGSRPLVVWTAASWMLVTPDAAATWRDVAGIGLALVVGGTMLWAERPDAKTAGRLVAGPDGATVAGPDGATVAGPDGATVAGPDGATVAGPVTVPAAVPAAGPEGATVASGRAAAGLLVAVLVAVLVTVLVCVPAQVRNALPALMALGALAAWTWTRNRPRASLIDP